MKRLRNLAVLAAFLFIALVPTAHAQLAQPMFSPNCATAMPNPNFAPPAVQGALCWDTTLGGMYAWNGSATSTTPSWKGVGTSCQGSKAESSGAVTLTKTDFPCLANLTSTSIVVCNAQSGTAPICAPSANSLAISGGTTTSVATFFVVQF